MRERDLRALEFDKVLASVAALARSGPGREAVLALSPSPDPATVRERLALSGETVALRAHIGSLPISEFVDQRPLVLAAAHRDAVLDGAALAAIRDFVLAARTLAAALRSRLEAFPSLAVLARDLAAPKELADAMLSALAGDGSIADDASPDLKRLRTRLRSERLELETRMLRSLDAPGMEPFVSDRIVTLRNRRFVMPLKPNFAERLEGIVQDRSVSGESLFVEPVWAIELNNRLMMLEREAEAEEYRIRAMLTAMVRGYRSELLLTFAAMVRFDVLNAMVLFAERLGGAVPEIAVDSDLVLVAARHPLLQMSGREVVPIDLRIAPGKCGIVISGPNAGGKTVALKTMGLFALMAQAGIPVPAQPGSRLPVFRAIYADIGDEQSIERNLSSFAAHVTNVAEILASHDEPALVVLDEPGAATDPAEGSALAIALLERLAARRCLLAVATHSTAVKLYAHSREDFEVAAVDFDSEHLAPLFRLKPDTIGQSFGLAIARRFGMPADVVATAERVLPEGAAAVNASLARLEAERTALREQSERLLEREREAAESAAAARVAQAQARERLSVERQRLRDEVRGLTEEIRADGQRLLAEAAKGAVSRRQIDRFAARSKKALESVAAEPPDERGGVVALKIGDQVKFGELRGELLELDAERAVVGRGGIRIEVSPARLGRVESSETSPTTEAGRREPFVVSSEAEPGGELNVIGRRVADALKELEQFLDRATLVGQAEVRIVHGIGSGALRRAIHEYLATSAYCESYHEAEPHQGGAGATVVKLRG